MLKQISIFHFDLYRLENIEDLEMIGVRDMVRANSICLVEWPDRGAGLLPDPDYHIHIVYRERGRQVEVVSYGGNELSV